MIHQMDIFGKDKVQTAIERLQNFSEIFSDDKGFFIAFSGGKDSVVVKKLADMSGIKYDAHYQLTTVDPPELVRFIKENHPDVIIDKARWEDGTHKTMWNLIPYKKFPPTQLIRYCCEHLKESAGKGRLIVTGVRWEESPRRKNNQGVITVIGKEKEMKSVVTKAEKTNANFTITNKGGVVLNNDNDETREVIEHCYTKHKTLLNPIIDWTTQEVWEFIHEYNVPYCELYDEGYKRLGCIGCPMSRNKKAEFERYPKYKAAYIRAFDEMIKTTKTKHEWKSGEEVFDWWIRFKM